MQMRELEARTGVHRETIRVFLRLGLIPEPDRPKRNIAHYGEQHVIAIAAVRTLQHDQNLTLLQIKAAMQGDLGSFPSGASGFQHLDELVASRMGFDTGLMPVSAVLQRNPEAIHDAKALQGVGAIELRKVDGVLHVSRPDAQLLALWGDMRKSGFAESNGFEPELVRIYVELATQLAKWEIGTFLALVEGVVEEMSAARMVEEAQTFMLSFFGIIRTKVCVAELAKQGNPKRRPMRPKRQKQGQHTLRTLQNR